MIAFEHFNMAEALLKEWRLSGRGVGGHTDRMELLAAAQVHATLALLPGSDSGETGVE